MPNFLPADNRRDILDAANRWRGPGVKPLTMRRIQWAVCCVRRHRLVDGHTLRAAGFNETER